MRTRPALMPVLAAATLVAGEAAGFALPGLAPFWPAAAYLFVLVLLAAHGLGARHAGWPMLFCLGVVLAFRVDVQLADLLAANRGRAGSRAPLALRVEGEVHPRARAQGGWTVDFASHAGPVPLKVVLPVEPGGRLPAPGERWDVTGWISRKEKGGRRFARRTLWVHAPDDARPRADGTDVCHARWMRLGAALSEILGAGLDWNPGLANLNRAILLGRREGISRSQRETFTAAGTIHVFAISGLHVMVVAWLLNTSLLWFALSPRARALVSLPVLWTYVVLTGSHPSAVRAALMASFCLLAAVFGRKPDALAAWALTALVVYGLHPERLFDVGCAFSFTVMLGIVLWIRARRTGVLQPAAERSRLRGYVEDFGVSFAAWAAGVPIAAHVFGRLTPGGLLANFIVIRCAKPLVQAGAAAMLAAPFSLPFAAVLNNVAGLFTWAMVFVSERVAALPFASFDVEPWSIGPCAAWYAGCLVVLLLAGGTGHRLLAERRWWR